MHIIWSFFKSYMEIQSRTGQQTIALETYMADPNFFHAKLAANCCIALGKAHCAVLNIDGEERIAAHMSIPVTKQVAQMLYEVPHHKVILGDGEGEKDKFVLSTDMSMEESMEVAKSLVALSLGKMEINNISL
jgi:hypothetical protein